MKTCPSCHHDENSPEHRATRQQCSRIKKDLHDAYIKTPAYRNEQAALLEAKNKQQKLKQIPFAPLFDKRGVPSRTNFL